MLFKTGIIQTDDNIFYDDGAVRSLGILRQQETPIVVTSSLKSRALLKGLRMVARALWRSEARRVVPWSETLHEP